MWFFGILIGIMAWVGIRLLLPEDCSLRQKFAAYVFGLAVSTLSVSVLSCLSEIATLLAVLPKG